MTGGFSKYQGELFKIAPLLSNFRTFYVSRSRCTFSRYQCNFQNHVGFLFFEVMIFWSWANFLEIMIFLSLSLPTILTKLFRRALSFFRPLLKKKIKVTPLYHQKSRPTSPKILLSKNQKTNTPTPLKLPLPLPLTPPHPHLYNITMQPSIIYIYIYPKRLQSLVRSGV